MDTEDLKRELTVADKWIRLLFIVLYVVLFRLAELVLAVTVLLQFLWTLFAGSPNPSLRDFGRRAGEWLRQVVEYMTHAADQRPWPFGGDWPDGAAPERENPGS
jgi:hypothetical protein